MELKNKCDIEHFLNDRDFCEWAKGNKPELNSFFNEYIQKNPQQHKNFYDALFTIQTLNEGNTVVSHFHKIEVWNQIRQKAKQKKYPLYIARKLFFRAAIILLIISIGSAIYLVTDENEYKKQMGHFPKEVSTETTLFLNDKNEIEIPAANSEIAYQNNGNEIIVNDTKKYSQEATEKAEELVYNQLTVPYGKKSKILLADGTNVWLNAGSRLIYPVKFGKKNRTVFLEGEGFFDVSKNEEKPFFIHTSLMKVKVVGTSFVVRAYPEEKTEETIVATGIVSISYSNKLMGVNKKIHPNQRAVTNKEADDFEVSEIKIKDFTAWLDDMLIFNDEPLEAVLKKIAWYYNVKINWDPEIEKKKLTGKLDLKQDYQKVMETISLTSNCMIINNNDTLYFKPK